MEKKHCKHPKMRNSVLKYHISVAAKIAAGSCGQKRRQKSCSFFIPDLTLNKSMINIPPPPMDVFGEAVCRITDRAKIQTTWIETNVKSNLQLLRTFLIQPIFIKIAVGSVDLSFSKDRMRTFLFCFILWTRWPWAACYAAINIARSGEFKGIWYRNQRIPGNFSVLGVVT